MKMNSWSEHFDMEMSEKPVQTQKRYGFFTGYFSVGIVLLYTFDNKSYILTKVY